MRIERSMFGDEGLDVVLTNGARVFVEAYSADLHGEGLGDGGTATNEDGWRMVRSGDEVVCIAKPAQRPASA